MKVILLCVEPYYWCWYIYSCLYFPSFTKYQDCQLFKMKVAIKSLFVCSFNCYPKINFRAISESQNNGGRHHMIRQLTHSPKVGEWFQLLNFLRSSKISAPAFYSQPGLTFCWKRIGNLYLSSCIRKKLIGDFFYITPSQQGDLLQSSW